MLIPTVTVSTIFAKVIRNQLVANKRKAGTRHAA
jgi:hypothetical protein